MQTNAKINLNVNNFHAQKNIYVAKKNGCCMLYATRVIGGKFSRIFARSNVLKRKLDFSQIHDSIILPLTSVHQY
jgi:hypothetical protein